jgi:hypothetical protein
MIATNWKGRIHVLPPREVFLMDFPCQLSCRDNERSSHVGESLEVKIPRQNQIFCVEGNVGYPSMSSYYCRPTCQSHWSMLDM